MVNIYFSVISGKNLLAREKRSFEKYPQEEKVNNRYTRDLALNKYDNI